MITWTEGRYGTITGVAGPGRVRLFTISWRTLRGDPDWLMKTSLPGMESAAWKDDVRIALERTAEDVLAGWLASVDAVRKTED